MLFFFYFIHYERSVYMKKLVITLSLFSLMITGCGDILNISGNDLQTGSNDSGSSSGTGGDTGSVVLAENGLFTGSNILDYDKSKQLHTLTYYAGNKYGDYMIIPPESEREQHTLDITKFFWKNKK